MRVQILIHVQRILSLHFRRFPIPIEMERIAGAVDVGAIAVLPTAAHVHHRIVRPIENAARTETLQGNAMATPD